MSCVVMTTVVTLSFIEKAGACVSYSATRRARKYDELLKSDMFMLALLEAAAADVLRARFEAKSDMRNENMSPAKKMPELDEQEGDARRGARREKSAR